MDEARHGLGRVAFLTPEFVTEQRGSKGVGNYVLKMATALHHHGVEAEVFVPSREPGVVEVAGIRVERVLRELSLAARAAVRLVQPLTGPRSELVLHLADAWRLARAFERRHRERPFDVVQSSNHQLTGSFVRADPVRRHVVRISTSRRLYDEAYGIRQGTLSRLTEWLDVRAARRADLTYAPSRYLADYFNATYGTDVHVLRPPLDIGAPCAAEAHPGVPERYLIHFGALGARKGTDVIARALHRAWERDPTLRMVWAGPISEDARAAYAAGWGEHRDKVVMVGALDKPQLYRVLSDAVAAVLPSTVDNLPNTVIESLTLRVPVIGSDGASIDELVEHGRSGALVAIGDVDALADAMLEAWQGRAPWLGDGFVVPESLREMQPAEAVRRFADLVGRIGR